MFTRTTVLVITGLSLLGGCPDCQSVVAGPDRWTFADGAGGSDAADRDTAHGADAMVGEDVARPDRSVTPDHALHDVGEVPDRPDIPDTLLGPSNLTYLGAFKPPQGTHGGSSWTYTGSAFAYVPVGDPSGPDDGFPGSLVAAGHKSDHLVGEYGIPIPSVSAVQDRDYSALPEASVLQTLQDITVSSSRGSLFDRWKSAQDNAGTVGIGDVLYCPMPGGARLCWSLMDSYNTGSSNDFDTFGWSGRDLSSPDAQGTWHVGSHDDLFHSVKTWGYSFDIPGETAAGLGGKSMAVGNFRRCAGGWCGGPSIYASRLSADGNPPTPVADADFKNGAELAATPLLYYPGDGTDSADIAAGNVYPDYCSGDDWSGGAWLESSSGSTVLLVASKGRGETCYKTNCPSFCNSNEGGYHCADGYYPLFAFYDPAALLEVSQGTRDPWVMPYATWDLTDLLWPRCRAGMNGVAYDRSGNLLYVNQYIGDGGKQVVHVFRIH